MVTQTWTTLGVLDWTARRFADQGITAARLEAQLLLAYALKCTRTQLYMNFDKPLAEPELAAYRDLIKRRLAGEPVAYLVHEHEFWGMTLTIEPSVLVPRADTETVIEVAKTLVAKDAALRVLDLCTGSGAIALALAKELPAAQVIAVELSPEAAAVARTNAKRNELEARVEVREGDLWAPVAGERFDLIASNPPYIATSVIAGLSAEVKREPVMALDGGADGMVFYDRICSVAREYLVPSGVLVVEHGYDQADAVRARFEAAGFTDVTLVNDLGKNPRVTHGKAP
ncbi:MAG: peptide chain release factor N(5)-glutamine methyltransferase [Kofleriaceae bacterium]